MQFLELPARFHTEFVDEPAPPLPKARQRLGSPSGAVLSEDEVAQGALAQGVFPYGRGKFGQQLAVVSEFQAYDGQRFLSVEADLLPRGPPRPRLADRPRRPTRAPATVRAPRRSSGPRRWGAARGPLSPPRRRAR